MNAQTPGGYPEFFDPREQESIDLNYYFWMLRKGKWIILSLILTGLLIAAYVNKTTTPVYSSTSTFIYTSDNSMARTLDMPGVSWFQLDAIRNDQIHLINSRAMAEQVADSVLRSPDADSLISILFNGNVPPRQYIWNGVVGIAQSRVSVSWVKDTDFFVLSGMGYSPEASAVITNLVLYVYSKWNQRQARGENREVRQFLEAQLDLMQTQLETSENDLLVFKESHGITDIDTETRNLINNLAGFDTQMRTATTNAEAARVRRDYLTGLLGAQRDRITSDMINSNSEYVRQIQNDLAVYEGARATLLAEGAAPDSDPVAAMEQRIATRREELIQALAALPGMDYPSNPERGIEDLVSAIASAEGEYRSNTARAQALERVVNALSANLSDLPQLEYQLISLERNRTVNENIYILLRTRFEEVRIAEVGQMGNVTIVDTALQGGMIRPTIKRNLLMGILAGLAAGIGLVFMLNHMDSTVRSPEHLEKFGIPLIGVIPRYQVKTGRDRIFLSIVEAPKSPNSEAIRDLRTSLSFVRPEKPVRSILVTSSGPQEGKSSISSNLAVAEAQAGKRVILLDCDLRRPMVNKIFGYQRKPGFTELVVGAAGIPDVLRKTEIEGLSAICSGHIPHNPAEIVQAAIKKGLFVALAEQCDLLVIDSPPAAVVTDAVSIAPNVDAVLLISRCGKVQQKVVQGVWQKLQRSGAHMAGAVINDFDPIRNYTSYSYYAYRYKYYYEDKH